MATITGDEGRGIKMDDLLDVYQEIRNSVVNRTHCDENKIDDVTLAIFLEIVEVEKGGFSWRNFFGC